MKKALPIVLTVAAFSIGAPAGIAFAQNPAPAAAAPAQASDPEAAATAAYTPWKAETDAQKKYDAGVQIVSQFPGTKAAEAVAYNYIFAQGTDQATIDHKFGVSKAYYDAIVAGGKEGQYSEYALGNLATLEKDPPKLIEYGRTYLQKYPSGKFVEYVKKATSAARYGPFKAALDAKRYPEAIKVADEAIAANDNVFIYAYSLGYAGLSDETATGAKSQFVGKVSAWADRSIAFVESGQVPDGADKTKWETDKPVTLKTMYKAKAVDTYLRVAQTNPTTPEALQPAVDELKKAIDKNEKDAALWYFISQAYSGQYGAYSTQYTAIPDDKKNVEPGPTLLNKVNESADKVIDSYIKLVAYAGETSPVSTEVKPKLDELWKFRHPDAPTAWQDEIKKVSGGATTAATPGK